VHEFVKTSLRVHRNEKVEEHWSTGYKVCSTGVMTIQYFCWRFQSLCKRYSSKDRQETKSKRRHKIYISIHWKFL